MTRLVRLQIWLANRILPVGWVAYPTEYVEDHLQVIAAQREVERLLARFPHLAPTATLLAAEPQRFM